jgi:hypothetical protein
MFERKSSTYTDAWNIPDMCDTLVSQQLPVGPVTSEVCFGWHKNLPCKSWQNIFANWSSVLRRWDIPEKKFL